MRVFWIAWLAFILLITLLIDIFWLFNGDAASGLLIVLPLNLLSIFSIRAFNRSKNELSAMSVHERKRKAGFFFGITSIALSIFCFIQTYRVFIGEFLTSTITSSVYQEMLLYFYSEFGVSGVVVYYLILGILFMFIGTLLCIKNKNVGSSNTNENST